MYLNQIEMLPKLINHKRLTNEGFKNIIIYLTRALDFCAMSLIILFDE